MFIQTHTHMHIYDGPVAKHNILMKMLSNFSISFYVHKVTIIFFKNIIQYLPFLVIFTLCNPITL